MDPPNGEQNGNQTPFPAAKSIQRDAARYLVRVIEDLHERYPKLVFDGLVCEIEQEGVGLYIHLHDTAGQTHEHIQKGTAQDDPVWFSHLLDLEEERIIAAGQKRVLDAVSEVLNKLKASGKLKQLGFVAQPQLCAYKKTAGAVQRKQVDFEME